MKVFKLVLGLFMVLALVGCTYTGGKKISTTEVAKRLEQKYSEKFHVVRTPSPHVVAPTVEANSFTANPVSNSEIKFEVHFAEVGNGVEMIDKYPEARVTYSFSQEVSNCIGVDHALKVGTLSSVYINDFNKSFDQYLADSGGLKCSTIQIALPYLGSDMEKESSEICKALISDLQLKEADIWFFYVNENDWKSVSRKYSDPYAFNYGMETNNNFVKVEQSVYNGSIKSTKWKLYKGKSTSEESFNALDNSWKENTFPG